MKFTLDRCVFEDSNDRNIIQANQECSEVCAGPNDSAKRALIDRLLQTNATLSYSYCTPNKMKATLLGCAACLNMVPNAKTLRNCEVEKSSGNELI